ncbi:MAG: glycerophosphodiester phosphodiesterase [Bacteroidota bacterium]
MFENFPRPLILAHRGDSAHAPENTLPAFEAALKRGADGVELDVKLTADKQVVVLHDTTVDRTTDGHGRVADLSLAQLRGLDAGSFFSQEFRGTRLPTLSEVFEAIGERCLINVELTNMQNPFDELAERTCELVRRHGMEKHVLFSSFFGFQLKAAARLLPDVPRGLLALPGWKGAWARSFGFMFGDYQALHPNLRDVNAAQVSRVHQLKRRIHVYTVNAPEDMRRLNNWDVDGVFTDDPESMLRTLGRTG